MIKGCLFCGRGLCMECGQCLCCKESDATEKIDTNEKRLSNSFGVGEGSRQSSNDSPVRSRRPKEDENVKDPESTGRKRAAVLYPLEKSNLCEWAGLKNCGGGKYPIIGCVQGTQQHRHHGPDKNTLNNQAGNVHRICDNCHNIWHSQNDADYDGSIQHQPVQASLDDLLDRQMKVRYVAR